MLLIDATFWGLFFESISSRQSFSLAILDRRQRLGILYYVNFWYRILTLGKLLMSLEKLQPAPPQHVGIYKPYYKSQAQQQLLPYAIGLYQQGSMEGNRKIEGGDGVPFIATWNISTLPADLTRCRVMFDGNPELSYELMLENHSFVSYLIDVIANFKRARLTDFPNAFYRKMLGLDDGGKPPSQTTLV
jgi:hypothetical protein